MAYAKVPKKDERAVALVGFTKTLLQRLDSDPFDARICADLERQIARSFPIRVTNARPGQVSELDELGTQAWNTSTRLARGRNEASALTNKRFLPLLRTFAFLLLDAAQQNMPFKDQKALENRIRVLRTALKAIRTCIDANEFDHCTTICQKAADYVAATSGEDRTANDGGETEAALGIANKLGSEYYLLRGALAWKQDRLDVAEHMLSRFRVTTDDEDRAALVENRADLLYEIGKDLLRKKEYVIAARWLERGFKALEDVDRDLLSPDANELRLSIIHDFARALLGVHGSADIVRAAHLASLLESEFGNRLAVCVLKLNILACQDPVPAKDFHRIIMTMITSCTSTESTFKTIMHQIQKLKDLDPKLACRALESFLNLRLYESRDQSRIDKTLVTLIWISTSQSGDSTQPTILKNTLDDIHHSIDASMEPEATHAAQTLIWKRIESANAAGQHGLGEEWCRLASHPLFDQAGELNKSKITRKIILSALRRGDPAAARQAYFQLPESGKRADMTKYLMYKVGLSSGDAEMASEALSGLVKDASPDPTYLYACVLEAQQSGTKAQVVAALQKLLDKYKGQPPEGLHLPALLRCTIRLLLGELDANGSNAGTVLPEVCRILEAAVAQSSYFRRCSADAPNTEEYASELQWFAKNSYNLALKHCANMHPNLLVRLLTVCVHFVQTLERESPPEASQDLIIRLALCHFLAASALVVEARAEDYIEASLQRYLDVRKHFQAFQAAYGRLSNHDLDAKRFELAKYELEAVLKLARWDDLDTALEQCFNQKQFTHLETLADLVIVAHSHLLKAQLPASYHKKIPLVMQRIINLSWQGNGKHDIPRLARWLRVVFQMTVDIAPDVSLQCVDQATRIATMTREAQGQEAYPADEHEWLAITCFNHAVDLHCTSETVACQQWGDRALNLAAVARDGGELHRTLQGQYLRLTERMDAQ